MSVGSDTAHSPRPASPRPLKPLAGDVVSLIGNTPMAEITKFDTGQCRLFAKLEYFNPGGSIKDRIALAMIEGAHARGDLVPGGTIVESTSGNTGLGLALIGRQKGYKVVIAIPDKMSQEKIQAMRALGARVIVTRSDVPFGHEEHYQTIARRIAAETPGGFYVDQHRNPDNPRAHEEGTAPEIFAQMDGKIDAIVCGIGTAGTAAGIGAFMRRHLPDIEMVLADPEGSILAEYVKSGREIEATGWLVEGIGEDVLPPLCDMSTISRAYSITDWESLTMARALLKREGIFGGSSTGTLLAGALRYCREEKVPKRVVVIVPDGGDRYLSKMYNDHWMLDQGFLAREEFGDLRDLISRRHWEQDDVVVAPDDSISIAHGRLKLYSISQLPVMADGRIVGVVHETDILQAVFANNARFADHVSSVMATNLKTLPPSASLMELRALFEGGYVALIAEGGTYYGLVTRIDLLQHLRRRVR